MTDLFQHTIRAETPKTTRVGYGNALFLADLATGATDTDLKSNIRAGKYPELAMRFVNGWRAMMGRTA